MVYERKIAWAFAMDDATWERHASPWSVWTRIGTLPLVVAAIWSRVWLGWGSLIPIGLVLAWIWLNPRLFARPRSTNNWASKGVLGERVWLNRDAIPVPERHRLVPHLLSAVAALGGLVLVYGLVVLEVWPTLFGATLAWIGKLWFVDRMVWLYEEMQDASPEYRKWLY